MAKTGKVEGIRKSGS